jgi:uncharacterized membrane protein YkvA (DUF1232 family)
MEDYKLKDLKKELTPVVKRVPRYAKLIKVLSTDTHLSLTQRTGLKAALGYLAMPFDLIPDSVPVLGHLDDIFAGLFAINSVLKTLTPERLEEVLKECDLSPEIVNTDQETIRRASKNLAKITAKKSTSAVTKFTSAWQKAFSKAAEEFKREYK